MKTRNQRSEAEDASQHECEKGTANEPTNHEREADREAVGVTSDAGPRSWIRFHTPSECRQYQPPADLMLIGDCHLVRGSVTVIAGPPGVGKSRAATGLAVAGATGQCWFGLEVHHRFKTTIIQNENGLYRLKKEYMDIDSEGLDDYVRVSEPPDYGMAFDQPEFCLVLAQQLEEFKPSVVVLDPWNSVAKGDKQKDYLVSFEALRQVLPKGDDAPALAILAHTRKPKSEDRRLGRSLLHDVAGSYILTAVPRTVFIMHPASDDPEDDRVVWTCSKNNDGQPGPRTAWHRRNGLFAPVRDFDWEEFDGKPGSRAVGEEDVKNVFNGGEQKLARRLAVQKLMGLTGLKERACYNALTKFQKLLTEDETGQLSLVKY